LSLRQRLGGRAGVGDFTRVRALGRELRADQIDLVNGGGSGSSRINARFAL
jgi:hypothetical protein